MSTANETISKLSEALNTLIVAYEELQKENETLSTQINDLTTQKDQVTQEKEILSKEKDQALQELNDLQKDVNVLSDNSDQQNSSMYNMLDKIESLLGNDTPAVNKIEKLPDNEVITSHVDEVFSDKQELEVEKNAITAQEEPKQTTASEQDSSKIDLNRMASLLNGFNK